MGQTARLGSKNGIGPMIMLIVPLQNLLLSCGQRGRRFQTDGGSTYTHLLTHLLTLLSLFTRVGAQVVPERICCTQRCSLS